MMEITLNEQFRKVGYLITLHTLLLAMPREEEKNSDRVIEEYSIRYYK